jgi:hypothetical protein
MSVEAADSEMTLPRPGGPDRTQHRRSRHCYMGEGRSRPSSTPGRSARPASLQQQTQRSDGPKSWRSKGAFAGRLLTMSDEVNTSEQATNFHNRAIAWSLRCSGFMYSDPMEACDVYTRQCSTLSLYQAWAQPARVPQESPISSSARRLFTSVATNGLTSTAGNLGGGSPLLRT